MLKKVVSAGVVVGICAGVALSSPTKWHIVIADPELHQGLSVWHSTYSIDSNQDGEEFYAEAPGGTEFEFNFRIEGTYEELQVFEEQVLDAVDFVSEEIFENEHIEDCDSKYAHPAVSDGYLRIAGTSLENLLDPDIMTHRLPGEMVPEYPSELLFYSNDAAFAFVCSDCDERVTETALVREISRYFAVQCGLDEDLETMFVRETVRKFTGRDIDYIK